MRQNLIKLSLFLESESLIRESWGIYRLIKIARTRNLVRTIFLTFYPEEVRGKVVSVSQSYYKTFKDSDPERLTEESLTAFLQENTLEDIILVLKDHKDKERDAVAETAINRFLNSKKLIPDELKIKLLEEHEAGLLRLEESDISKKNYAWAVKILLNEEQDPMEEIIEAIRTWNSAKHNLKDLYEYEKLSDLRKAFDGLGVESKRAYYYSIKQHAANERNTDIIYDSDNFTVVLCGTIQSSQWWAQGTVWCTASLTGNMFDHYSSKGIYLYYLITKNDEVFEAYKPDGWYGIGTRETPFEEKKNSYKKISIGYTKNGDDLIFLNRQNATVDSNNQDISKVEILKFLGDEGQSVFSAIEGDLAGRESTKFEEIRNSTTPEELRQTLRLLDDRGTKYDLVESFASSESAKKETVEYALSLLASNEISEWYPYSFFLREYNSRAVKENYPDLWDKYKDMAFKNMVASPDTAATFLEGGHYRDYPEHLSESLKNLTVSPGKKQMYSIYNYRSEDYDDYDYYYDYDESPRDNSTSTMSLDQLSHFIDLNEEVLNKEETREHIKKIFDNAIVNSDPNIMEVKKRILNKIYQDNPDFDKLVLAPLLKEVMWTEPGESARTAAMFFHNIFGWYKHFPELKNYALDIIISNGPEMLRFPPTGVITLVDIFPELWPVAIWGMSLEQIFEENIYSEHPNTVYKLFAQINDGGRKAIHPKLFSGNNQDHMRSHDLNNLTSPGHRNRFTSVLRENRDDPGDFQDIIDKRDLGMDLNQMLKGEYESLSDSLRRDIAESQSSGGFMDDIRKSLIDQVNQSEPEYTSESEEVYDEAMETTWGDQFPELHTLLEDRKARLSKLYQMMKQSKKGEVL